MSVMGASGASGLTLKRKTRVYAKSGSSGVVGHMARRHRVQFPEAVYHMTFRGNGRAATTMPTATQKHDPMNAYFLFSGLTLTCP